MVMKILRKPMGETETFGLIFEQLALGPMLELPDHLRKTFIALTTYGRATASEITKLTDRARAVESGYLNQLVLLGYAEKHNDGRKKVFTCALDGDWMQLLNRMNALKPAFKSCLAGDMLTALRNRLDVFER